MAFSAGPTCFSAELVRLEDCGKTITGGLGGLVESKGGQEECGPVEAETWTLEHGVDSG